MRDALVTSLALWIAGLLQLWAWTIVLSAPIGFIIGTLCMVVMFWADLWQWLRDHKRNHTEGD